MKMIEPPDSFHLQAAEGWLGLGDHIEADAELAKIKPHLRARADVLKLCWEVYAAGRKWEAALDVAAALLQLNPGEPLGWVFKSRALHGLKRTSEARNNLLGVVDKFPTSVSVFLDLACYECKMGDLDKARQWLARAFKLGRVCHQ